MTRPTVTRRYFIALAGAVCGAQWRPSLGAQVHDVAPQPYFAGVKRALEELQRLGAPVAPADAEQIAALASRNDSFAVEAAEAILRRYTLAKFTVESYRTARLAVGDAPRMLLEQGWRMFLIRVVNKAQTAYDVRLTTQGSRGNIEFVAGATPGRMSDTQDAQRTVLQDTVNYGPIVESYWLTAALDDSEPLSGIPIEYRVVQIFSRDRGRRKARLHLDLKAPPHHWSPGVAGNTWFDFTCVPTKDVALSVIDDDERSCIASLTITDSLGRVYPPQAMRIAPDMAFQPQIYRADGESIRLPDGGYTVESGRGPEYLPGRQRVTIDGTHRGIRVKLKRWIDVSKWGWYSGDTHIHAAGCAHYPVPTEGVSPETIIRHARGEGLSIADVLTWGSSWYYQKQFFSGRAVSPSAALEHPELQVANHVTWQPHPSSKDFESTLRYDIEVSGFPSSHAGHLVLLRLSEMEYPGTKLIGDWPSWNLPILKWAKAQGAVVGYAHCGDGMEVESSELPNYEIPPMDGVGTQEAIIDVTHGVVDFLSGCDTDPSAELNAWYHLLNCGFRLAMIGETDWPCITEDRVGAGRSYVHLKERPVGNAGYEAWILGLKQGRLYCGDGRTHFLEFGVNGQPTGETDLELRSPVQVRVEALVAAYLGSEDSEKDKQGKWGIQWARIGHTREVFVELIVNGVAAGNAPLLADGTPRSVSFTTAIARSSWIALRVLPSAHTHPLFVTVANRPLRASRRSAQWCRACVAKVWEVKSPFIRESERDEAAKAFDHARKTYDRIIGECEVP